MKRNKLYLCLLLLASGTFMLSSCSKSDITFDLPVSVSNVSYGAQPNKTHIYTSQPCTINLDSIVRANGGSLSNLKSIKLKSLVVGMVSPAGKNFDDFGTITSWIKSGTDSVELAYSNPVPTGTSSVTFSNNATEFSNIVKTNNFSLDLDMYMSNVAGVPAETVSSTAVFTVTVGP